jgi:hypothetical protein
MSMNFSTSGTAHCETEPQPMMSNRPLNFMQNSVQLRGMSGSYRMTGFISTQRRRIKQRR